MSGENSNTKEDEDQNPEQSHLKVTRDKIPKKYLAIVQILDKVDCGDYVGKFILHGYDELALKVIEERHVLATVDDKIAIAAKIFYEIKQRYPRKDQKQQQNNNEELKQLKKQMKHLQKQFTFLNFGNLKESNGFVILVSSANSDRFRVSIDEGDNIALKIRDALKHEISYWWCSLVTVNNKHLCEKNNNEVLNKLKNKDFCQFFIRPITLTPAQDKFQRSKASKPSKSSSSSINSFQKEPKIDHPKIDHKFKNVDNIILETDVDIQLVISGRFECEYIHEPVTLKLLQNAIPKLQQNNKQKIFKNDNYVENVSFEPYKPTKFSSKYKNFTLKMGNRYCFLTGVTNNLTNSHILKKSIQACSVLWLLHDMIWKRICKWNLVSPNDFRNMLVLESRLQDEFDNFAWAIFPHIYYEDELDTLTSVSQQQTQDDDEKIETNDFHRKISSIQYRVQIFTGKKNQEIKNAKVKFELLTKSIVKYQVSKRCLALHYFQACMNRGVDLQTDFNCRAWNRVLVGGIGQNEKTTFVDLEVSPSGRKFNPTKY